MQVKHILTGETRYIREWTPLAAYLAGKLDAVIADQRDGARPTRCDMGAFEFAACLLIGDVDDEGDVDVQLALSYLMMIGRKTRLVIG